MGPKKIQADYAWNTTIGSSDILVAILDTGIDYTHPDLATNYVPLGFDWVNWDPNPMDDNGHGTHCAGIVAAKLNNSIGIAGLAQVRIMTEKVLDQWGSGYYSWLIQGIYDAVSKRAKIVSMSLGGSADSAPLHEAVKYAQDHGVVVVASAGNSGDDAKHYPAAYEEAIAVSATDSDDNLASFSTYGYWVDLSAPGVSIISTYRGNSYATMSGTSMACPHVAGVAALAWSAFPTASGSRIRQLLERTADDLGDGGFDFLYGFGRVNARKAVVGIQQHDLAISKWEHPYRFDPGKVVAFNVTVSNYGENNETSISVQFFANQTLVDSVFISSLAVDASELVSFSWSTAIVGSYNVTCYVVPVAGENATENNVVYSRVLVRYAAVLRVPADYSTIEAALDEAGDGDTVLVSEGVYAERTLCIRKSNITLRGDGYVVLEGTLEGHVLKIIANNVVVEGFEIRRASAYAVTIKGKGNILRRNSFWQTLSCLYVYYSQGCIISLNNFSNIDGYPLVLDHSSNCTLSQNILYTSYFHGGITLRSSSNNTVIQNTVIGGTKLGYLPFMPKWALLTSRIRTKTT